MQRDVAVVGYAHTELTPEIGKSRERVIFDLTSEFFSSKGMTRDDVETFIFASNDFCDGRTISNVFIDDPAGVYMKDETKVESDGTNAVLYALMRILSGQYENALVIGMGLTGSEARTYMMTDYILDPTYDRQMGIMNELSTAALQAHAYLGRYGLDDKVLDAVAARNLRCAASNPRAMSRVDEADEGKVASSPFLYEPLRELHCYPPTDGACVILLASGDRAGDFTDKPVWIRGIGQCIESYWLGERELHRSVSTASAAERAYGLAGIKDPSKEIDVAEISSLFASQEPILLEALGLFEEGEAGKAALDGSLEVGGKLPVNPSGGPLGAHPICVTGLIRIAEAARQLQGDAGECQVEGAKKAVVHGQDGVCAQQNCVLVLEG